MPAPGYGISAKTLRRIVFFSVLIFRTPGCRATYLAKNGRKGLISLRGAEKMATFDKRRHRRSSLATAVEYALGPLHTDETCDGVLADISESGFCLLTTTLLHEGQKVLVKINPAALSRTAVVRWSQCNDNLYCRAGLEFI